MGWVYTAQMPGTAPIYNCQYGNDEYIFTSTTCNGGTLLNLIGYIYTSPPAGIATVPLWRCYFSSTDYSAATDPGCWGAHVDYQLGYILASPSGIGSTQMHVTNATEPNGFTRNVTYDGTYRTIVDTDAANLATSTTWDPVEDKVLASTDPTGLESTTIYDYADRPTDQYGPAPAAWFGSNYQPTSTYTNQVPHTQSAYDGSINGLATAYYNVTSASNGTGASTRVLFGSPKAHATGVGPSSGDVNQTWNATPPITPDSGDGWGARLTGAIHFTANGTYTFRGYSNDGMRVWVDDVLVIDDWADGAQRSHSPLISLSNSSDSWHRIKVDYYTQPGGSNAMLQLFMTPPGGSETSALGSLMKPQYGLVTSNTVYDSTLGNTVATSNYGSTPELGLLQSATVDASGLNYSSSSTYETPGTGSYLRQTAKTLPGGNTYTYQYYGATETRVNPCNSAQTFAQAGRMKLDTQPNPGGSGTALVTESVYDDTGRVVATHENSDPWTCTTYDSRGRVAQTVVPTISGRTGRTISYNYAVSGNPLVGSSTDSTTGTSSVTIDLLGRMVNSTDTFGYTSTVSYDSLGRVSQQVSLKGTEVPTYDNLSRVTGYAVDGTTYATLTYDAYGRVATVTYPQSQTSGNKLQLSQITRDSLQRVIGSTFTFSNATTMNETVTLSPQKGIVTADSITQGGHTAGAAYQYDSIGRLTQATVDNWQYQYGFGAQASACTSIAGYNANANKNGNRTSTSVTNTLTSTNVTSTNCYNTADQLTQSSDPQIGTPTYDDHGNITQLAGNGTPLTFTYDATDANTAIQQGTNSVQYTKSASGAVLTEQDYVSGVLTKVYRHAGGVLLTCDLVNQSSCTTLDKYIGLPGGVGLTIENGTPIYSVKNFHGDTAITVAATGLPTSGVFLYDPFGQVLASNTFGTNLGGLGNASDSSMGWAASPTRKATTMFSVPIIQMGARTYLPTMGRFLQVDPVEGGNDNAYSYVNDPINANDYSGQQSQSLWGFIVKQVTAAYHAIVPAPIRQAIASIARPIAAAIVSTFSKKTTSNSNTRGNTPVPGMAAIKTGAGPGAARAAAESIGHPVPDTYTAVRADNGKGWVFREPGTTGNANTIRVMEPVTSGKYQYPNGYVRVYDRFGQVLDGSGNPGLNKSPDTHFPLGGDDEPILPDEITIIE